jgi:hypothetical protein
VHVVSENSERDLARKRAMEAVDWALRDLTANLLRVARGAGKPHAIAEQARALAKAYERHRDVVGHDPDSADVSAALGLDDNPPEGMSNENRAFHYAEARIIRGAMQTVASELLSQGTQRAAGRSEMFDGINQLEDLRAENRRKRGRGDPDKALAAFEAAVKLAKAKPSKKL